MLITARHGLGRVDAPDTDVSRLLPPLRRITPAQEARRRRLTIAGTSFYLYDSHFPEHFDPARGVSTRGGLADLLARFSREVSRRAFIEAEAVDVVNYRAEWDRRFAAGTPPDLLEVNDGADFPRAAERLFDLRPWLDAPHPATGRPWRALFTAPARERMGLTRRGAVYFLLIDWSASAINFNADLLAALGVSLPIRDWAGWIAALEAARAADYDWPIAISGSPNGPGLFGIVTPLQDMVFGGRLFRRMDRDRDGVLNLADWRAALARRTFSERAPEYREFARLLKEISRFFLWYFERTDSIGTKPFYFSRRPQCLFRAGDFRRVRMDMDNYDVVRAGRRLFPFREGAMPVPEITRDTTRFASGPARGLLHPSLYLGVSRAAVERGTAAEAVRFLQWFTQPEQQRFFTAWSRTVSATRGVPAPAELRALGVSQSAPHAYARPRVEYLGISDEARAIYQRAVIDLCLPTGHVPAFLAETRRVLDLDRAFLAR
ncbi:MAG: extracellular solute-binding protein [Planctomycetes bacterium]|nr:extracellular solute-binding protein [Planctomycetota bacterium]